MPENEEALRSHDFQETTKEALGEVQDLIEQEEESQELFMIKQCLAKELKGTLIQNKKHYQLIKKGLNGRKFKLQKIMTGSKDGFTI